MDQREKTPDRQKKKSRRGHGCLSVVSVSHKKLDLFDERLRDIYFADIWKQQFQAKIINGVWGHISCKVRQELRCFMFRKHLSRCHHSFVLGWHY